MRKKIWIVIAVLLIISVVGISVFSYKMSRTISHPSGNTLGEEEQWEKDHGLWGEFDSYPKEEYTVAGLNDYILHCEVVRTVADSKKYVIISHGFGSNRYGAVKYVSAWKNNGYNAIIYDVRGHGENEKTAVSLGQFESQDLLAIIDDAYSRFGNDIELGLQGESMGSSISLCTLQYKPNVKFVVADCGFTNLYELIGAGYKTAGMGAWTPLINTALILADGFDMKKTSAIDAIKDNTIPICFIHGEDDAFIVPENSRKLSEATKGYQELHLIPKAGHAESREVAGEGSYSDIIQSFIKNAVD